MSLPFASNTEAFRQSFREEARDILVELEATLLELHEHPADTELVGRAFRGLHTIKGSGAMFGFDELAAFTHDLENAFDEVRNGRLEITPELVDLTLSALDQIRAMIEDSDDGNSAQGEEANRAVRERILIQVRALCGLPGREKSAADARGAGALVQSPILDSIPDGAATTWKIAFEPGPDLMRDGTNPLLLLNELRQMGTLAVATSLSAIPPLAEIDPERCYIAWELELSTSAPLEAIRDVFIFVEDVCELTLDPIPAKQLAANGLGAHATGTKDAASGRPPAGSQAEGQAPADGKSALPDATLRNEADLAAKRLAEQRSGAPGRRPYDKPDNASSIRVPAAKLDQFVDLVGELVTVQARLGEIATRRNDPDVVAVSEEIERLTSALRENSMNIRMVPIRATFERFRRLVHDLARDLGKSVELNIEGADTELDKTVIDQLGDPLMHLIRNSMDHGIEPAEKRRELGKRPTATIRLSARYSGANVLIAVSDDGRGINADAVRHRAIERGLISAEAQLSETEVFNLIFEPGFSTAPTVTDVSGRGVGMDVVRQRVQSLRGTIDVHSKPGAGTSVTLRLPLTLAIIDGLLVVIGTAFFVLPLANILECIELTREDIERANGKHVAYVRGEIIPYIRLRQHFNIRSERPEREQIMVVETDEGRYGFVVDEVLGDYQTVIKNLGALYRHVQVVSGATILGNGTVALILDPHRLVEDALRLNQQPGRAPGSQIANGGARPRDGTLKNALQNA